jgi:hypothetical protein
MSTVKVKEIKDDAIINVPVNKSFYIMVKALLYNLFLELQKKGITEEFLQTLIKKPYAEMTDEQRSFYTVTLLLGEIERQATLNDAFEEKEINVDNMVKPEESEPDSKD